MVKESEIERQLLWAKLLTKYVQSVFHVATPPLRCKDDACELSLRVHLENKKQNKNIFTLCDRCGVRTHAGIAHSLSRRAP